MTQTNPAIDEHRPARTRPATGRSLPAARRNEAPAATYADRTHASMDAAMSAGERVLALIWGWA